MKTLKTIIPVVIFMIVSSLACTNSNKNVEMEIDSVAQQMPAESGEQVNALAEQVIATGKKGYKIVCDMVTVPGTGDDTQARFVIESTSRYLSQAGKEQDRKKWEKVCVLYVNLSKDSNVKDFFFKQLNIIGSDYAVSNLKLYLTDAVNCEPAVSAMAAIGGAKVEVAFAEALENDNLPCAASVINALASMNSQIAVDEFVKWSDNDDVMVKAAAYNALACSGHPKAMEILKSAAEKVSFQWELSGATASYYKYLDNMMKVDESEGFTVLFDGNNLYNWIGNKESYVVEDGVIVIRPDKGSGGNLYTEKEYSDFNFRFEFQLTPDANNGLGIRTPTEGDAAYVGMELQILDNTAEVYSQLQPYQYHGSVYGVIPAKRDYLNPVGSWNYQEVIVQGTSVKVILNGTVIVDGDIADARDNGSMDKKEHPGLHNASGHIGFLGHGYIVRFKNIRIKEL